MTIRAAVVWLVPVLVWAASGCAVSRCPETAHPPPASAPSTPAAAHPAPAAADPALAPVAFLAGSWFVEKGDGERIEEQWTTPAGGAMLATGRTLRGGKTVFFEFLRIESGPSGLVYIAQPRGKEPTEFKLAESAEGKVVFANPAHDFPNRISYSRRSDGAIDVRIEGDNDGKPASEAWVLSAR